MNKPKVFRVLVLCTGNICRSPIAETMLRKKLSSSNIAIDSAGLAAPIGVPVHRSAVRAAAALGYSTDAAARSKGVASTDLLSANLVLVMDQQQRRAISSRFPGYVGKTFLIGHWGQGEIPDPITMSDSFFDEVAAQLEKAAEAWSCRIRESLNPVGGV